MQAVVLIRPFGNHDAAAVRALFIVANRLLAPSDLQEAFESYIVRSLAEEMERVAAYYGERGGSFWVAVQGPLLVGMFGLEPATPGSLELRRMYVEPAARRRGIASMLLQRAELECRRSGRDVLTLSTSELQTAALGLYRKAGYVLTREEVADQASHKTVGGGIRRFHFAKTVSHEMD